MESVVAVRPRPRLPDIGFGAVPVRWRIFLFMFLFPLLCYVQRNSLTIATDQVKAQLHVSQLQVFLLSSAFMVMYTALQVPGGAVCFVLAYGCHQLNEGPVAAATMQIARADSMSGFGVINTGGNLAGVLLFPLLGYLSGRGEWNLAFVVAAGCCLAAAASWLLVRADRPFSPENPAAIDSRLQVAA